MSVAVDKPKVIKIVLLVEGAFAFALCVSSFVVAQNCYVSPCYKGQGFVDLWRIGPGRSFQVVGMGIMAFAHVFWVYMTLFKNVYDDLRYGMVVTTTGLLGVFLLCQATVWGQESVLIDNLQTHINGYFYEEDSITCQSFFNQTHDCSKAPHCAPGMDGTCELAMTVNTGTEHPFNATCAFSVMLALTEFVLFYLLFSWRSSFGYQFGGEPSFVGEVDVNPRHKSAGRPASFVPTDSIDAQEAGGSDSYQDTENLRL